MKTSFLLISCDEAKHICDKVQYNEATAWERFKLKLRLSWCHITKSYSEQNTQLSHNIYRSGIDCLTLKEKDRLKRSFKTELAKHKAK